MKTYLDCLPCFMEQVLCASRIATRDDKLTKQVLDEVGCMSKDTPMENTPAESGRGIYGKIREIIGVIDPYREIKRQHIAEARSLYPKLEKIVENAKYSLLTAIRTAIAGNMIDLGINKAFDVVTDIQNVLLQDFAVFDYDAFKSVQICKSKSFK